MFHSSSVSELFARAGLAICFAVNCAGMVNAQPVTSYDDRIAFETAVAELLTVEAFTPTDHFPISSGVLNSETSEPLATNGGINPGDIMRGVTYSTPIGVGNFFNIDAGGGYSGGFLNSSSGSNNMPLTIGFWGSTPSDAAAVSAFGFDSGVLDSSDLELTISFISRANQTFTLDRSFGQRFYGFQSDVSDIVSVEIFNGGVGSLGFDLDNFTFTNPAAVPEPSSLLATLCVGVCVLSRRQKRSSICT
jgi:hypothetical protein